MMSDMRLSCRDWEIQLEIVAGDGLGIEQAGKVVS